MNKADGNRESLETPKTQATPDRNPDPETPGARTRPGAPRRQLSAQQRPGPQERPKRHRAASRSPTGLSRRQALTVLGAGAGALIAEQALVADGIPPSRQPSARTQHRAATQRLRAGRHLGPCRRPAAQPVQLLDSPFRQNQARNTTYLLFLDPERMLRSFRLNYGLPSSGRAARRLGEARTRRSAAT